MPKWVNHILNTIGVNSHKLGGFHIEFEYWRQYGLIINYKLIVKVICLLSI